MHEAEVMMKLDHPHIVRIIGEGHKTHVLCVRDIYHNICDQHKHSMPHSSGPVIQKNYVNMLLLMFTGLSIAAICLFVCF